MGDETVPQVSVEDAARRLLAALDVNRDAINGEGHPGEDHDRWLHFDPCTNLSGVAHVYDHVSDCSACGGAQYGSDYGVNGATGDLREALGGTRNPWESYT